MDFRERSNRYDHRASLRNKNCVTDFVVAFENFNLGEYILPIVADRSIHLVT